VSCFVHTVATLGCSQHTVNPSARLYVIISCSACSLFWLCDYVAG